MKPQVKLLLDADHAFYRIYYVSLLHAGFCALARRGCIDLRYRSPRCEKDRLLVADPQAISLEIEGWGEAGLRRVVIDLHDQSDIFATEAIGWCDTYLKRSFHRPDVEKLPSDLAQKVLPFGLIYPCWNPESIVRLLRFIGLRLALRGSFGLRLLKLFLLQPSVTDFEQGPDSAIEPTVVFQTRVWEAHETAEGETEAINEGRVAVIRALKNAFGDRFRGGLVPTPLALARYPDEISLYPAGRRLYTAMSKRNLIGVYTRGLHQSTAFKLAEYLAASQCIVAEPPRNELPVPLEEGRNYLPFQTPDECIAACQRLLEDHALAEAMRRANHGYYIAEVEPTAHMMRHLARRAAAHDAASGPPRSRDCVTPHGKPAGIDHH